MAHIKRGDIYYANLDPVRGSEQGGTRPVLVIQNNTGNKFSPTVIIAAITCQKIDSKLPTHITLMPKYGLKKKSIVLLEQIRTIDKNRLTTHIGSIEKKLMCNIDSAVACSLGLNLNLKNHKQKEIQLNGKSKRCIRNYNSRRKLDNIYDKQHKYSL